MKKITFVAWVLQQADRDDPIGDFARDVRNDLERPSDDAGYQIWLDHVGFRSRHDHVVEETFKAAWKEYKASLK